MRSRCAERTARRRVRASGSVRSEIQTMKARFVGASVLLDAMFLRLGSVAEVYKEMIGRDGRRSWCSGVDDSTLGDGLGGHL